MEEFQREIERAELQMPSIVRAQDTLGTQQLERYKVNSLVSTYDPSYRSAEAEGLQLRREIGVRRERITGLTRKMREMEREIVGYIAACWGFVNFARGHGSGVLVGLQKSDPEYHAWVTGEMLRLERGLEILSLPVGRRDGGLIVETVIDSTFSARLAVDPSSEFSVLYGEASARLRRSRLISHASLKDLQGAVWLESVMNPGGRFQQVLVPLGDGTSVYAQPMILHSIEVGGFRVERSAAALLDVREKGFDGVLGASFLDSFFVQLDRGHGKMILVRMRSPVAE